MSAKNRRGHNHKTHRRWRSTREPGINGDITWTTKAGRTYVTRPHDYRDPPARASVPIEGQDPDAAAWQQRGAILIALARNAQRDAARERQQRREQKLEQQRKRKSEHRRAHRRARGYERERDGARTRVEPRAGARGPSTGEASRPGVFIRAPRPRRSSETSSTARPGWDGTDPGPPPF
ncbi:hypothetical protein GCM10025883_14560 [Mobilicoccus caccae]|uniref:Uncharacterized protein n=1 Tax=Mobilicoccus caccae TaxID=1859295 RepID=A0ABQ6IPM9_9MICO|nr:hypothetical protein GCM10025883_14560 [Mobilicoccus caccae]